MEKHPGPWKSQHCQLLTYLYKSYNGQLADRITKKENLTCILYIYTQDSY